MKRIRWKVERGEAGEGAEWGVGKRNKELMFTYIK